MSAHEDPNDCHTEIRMDSRLRCALCKVAAYIAREFVGFDDWTACVLVHGQRDRVLMLMRECGDDYVIVGEHLVTGEDIGSLVLEIGRPVTL